MSNDILTSVSNDITLALQLGQTLVPIISGVVKDIKVSLNADGTIEYTMAITTGQANLDKAQANFQEALDIANAELQKQSAVLHQAPSLVSTLLNPVPVPAPVVVTTPVNTDKTVASVPNTATVIDTTVKK